LAIVQHGCECPLTLFSRDTDLSVSYTVANMLDPRPGPTKVGPDLGSSLVAPQHYIFFKRNIAIN